MVKCGGLDFYDEDRKKRYAINHEVIEFVKNYGWSLIIIPDEPDGTSTDHDFYPFRISFYRILATHQKVGTSLKIINIFSSKIINESITKQCKKKEELWQYYTLKYSPEKDPEKCISFSYKFIDYFRFIVIDTPPKLKYIEMDTRATSFGTFFKYPEEEY